MSKINELISRLGAIKRQLNNPHNKDILDDVCRTLKGQEERIDELFDEIHARDRKIAEYEDKIERGELVEANGNEDIETVNRPCAVCRKIKNGKEFEVRDDNAKIQKVTHISYCPYCGRFLAEHFGGERSVENEND